MPAEPPLDQVMRSATCPACGHHVAAAFYDGGRQPLATLGWPQSAAEAQAMPRFPLSFVRCVDCGHVYNAEFEYSVVPYSDKPNLMFNRGTVWSGHLEQVKRLILERIPADATVVEVGCGDGRFLRELAQACPGGRFIGFDPNAPPSEGPVETRRCLFDPARHLAELRPTLIVSRHVLEHLMNPLGFVQAVAFAASWLGLETLLFIEVPCVDQVLQIGRTVDFYYEHNSHFTSASLRRLLERCADSVELVERGFGGEVVYGFARFRPRAEQVALARASIAFRDLVTARHATTQEALAALVQAGKSVAIWGGTGKGAAFIHQHRLDAVRFPLVVDSDPDKEGTFVPGSGQEIRFRDYLLEHPVAVILIATQWRAPDIADEIRRHRIPHEMILIEHEGRLIDFWNDVHPYRMGEQKGGA